MTSFIPYRLFNLLSTYNNIKDHHFYLLSVKRKETMSTTEPAREKDTSKSSFRSNCLLTFNWIWALLLFSCPVGFSLYLFSSLFCYYWLIISVPGALINVINCFFLRPFEHLLLLTNGLFGHFLVVSKHK